MNDLRMKVENFPHRVSLQRRGDADLPCSFRGRTSRITRRKFSIPLKNLSEYEKQPRPIIISPDRGYQYLLHREENGNSASCCFVK